MIENTTIYKGKLYTTIERKLLPDTPENVLNKVICDLKIFKIVSRLRVSGLDFDKIERIKKETNIKVLIGGWKSILDKNGMVEKLEFEENKWDPLCKLSQILCFTQNENLIGHIETGWWFVQNGLVADNEIGNIAFQAKTQSWIGFGRGAAVPFKVGDKLFDETWTGDYSPQQLENMKFIERGSITITTLEQAKEAAINFANYMS